MAEVKHDSGSVIGNAVDPAAGASAAMGDAAVRQASWATARSGAGDIPADLDLSISDDDSFTMKTPPTDSRRKAASRGPRERAGRRQSMTIRSLSASSKRRGGHRPPSPSVERAPIPDHVIVQPKEDNLEARLQALERQQRYDHATFANRTASVRSRSLSTRRRSRCRRRRTRTTTSASA